MKRLNYNIAENKEMDVFKFSMSLSILVLLSAILIYFGINNISGTNSSLREKINLKKHFLEEQEKILKDGKLFEGKINDIKKGWNKRILFANRVIELKEFSFLDRLTFFERVLPDMIQIDELTLVSAAKDEIKLKVSSYSTDRLYLLYKRLIKYNLVISSESEKDGVYTARLKIIYRNEKN